MDKVLLFAFTLVIYLGCQSMLQNKGSVYYINTKQGENNETMAMGSSNVNNGDFINFNAIDSILRKFTLKGKSTEKTNNLEKSEVINMESMLTELTTAITSAIAGVYCLVKVIMNIIAKFKKQEAYMYKYNARFEELEKKLINKRTKNDKNRTVK